MLWFPRLLLLLLLMHAFAVALQVEGVRELLAAVLAAEALHAAVQHEVARQGRLPFKLPVSPRVADPDPAFFSNCEIRIQIPMRIRIISRSRVLMAKKL
jgi:hypothetical protein